MGYWNGDAEGSFRGDLTWGDGPADVVDDAIIQIVDIFQRDVGRKPTKEELMAGFKFSWNGYDEED